jgi:hypothetical protein
MRYYPKNIRKNWQFLKVSLGMIMLMQLFCFGYVNAATNSGSFELSSSSYAVNKSAGKIDIGLKRVGGSSGAVTVGIRTQNETAKTQKDYIGFSSTILSFAHGESQKVISIPIIDNKLSAGNKTFQVRIGIPTGGATLGSKTVATVTIVDNGNTTTSSITSAGTTTRNPGSFELSSSAYTVNKSAGKIDIGLKRVGGSSGAVTVGIRTQNETAKTQQDYVGFSSTILSFANGETQKVISIPIIDNKLSAGNKTFQVRIGIPNGGATLGSKTVATVTIVDDDSLSSTSRSNIDDTNNSTPSTTTPTTRTKFSLRGDPSFSASKLSGETKLWHDRLWAAISNSRQSPNPTELAGSNNLYDYGRGLNTYITSLLHAFRVTGDLRILDEIDRLAQIMRTKLKDSSILTVGGSSPKSDGYLNWIYNRDNEYKGTDVHEMDDMLTHSMVAAVAYAFHINKDLNSKYQERANFWTNYLKNHFEAKWRARKKKATGFPFLEKKLTHAYAQWNRYHYYMYKLTGEKGYYDEAVRMAQVVKNGVKTVSTPIGQAAMWDHGMPHNGGKTHGPQPSNYARYTIQAMADLSLEGFNAYAESGFMERVAHTVAALVLNKAPSALAGKIDGSGSTGVSIYGISPFAQVSLWDKSGLVKTISEQIYKNTESNTSTPRRIYTPTGLMMSTK